MPKAAAWILLASLVAPCVAQTAAPATSATPMPRDYRGVQVHVDGIFVTPVPNAPFTATVQIVSHQKLPDGTEHVVKTINHIARSSSGRIRNERRQLTAPAFVGEPRLLSVHLYDPNTRLSTFFDPQTRPARQETLPAPMRTPSAALPQAEQRTQPDVTVTDLGTKPFQGIELHGTRKERVIDAVRSGTGQPVTITDEYWYSPELSIYLVIRHNDPRTGEQMVAVTDIQRTEPAAELMVVPPEYKVVDETPPPPTPAATHPASSAAK